MQLRRSRRFARTGPLTAVAALALLLMSPVAWAQLSTSATDVPWTGSVQCILDVTAAGYVNRQTHTWTITGPAPPGAIRDYPGTWAVTGDGSLQPGTRQPPISAEWKTSASKPGLRIGIFVRESDGVLLVVPRHGLLSVPDGTRGTQRNLNSAVRAPLQEISLAVEEWRPFPVIQGPRAATRLNGTATIPLITRLNYLQPLDARGQAVCTWDLVKGGSLSAAPQVSPREAASGIVSTRPAISSQPQPATGTTTAITPPSTEAVATAGTSAVRRRLPGDTGAATGTSTSAATACDHSYYPLRTGATWTYGSSQGTITLTVQSVSGDMANAKAVMVMTLPGATSTYDVTCDAAGLRLIVASAAPSQGDSVSMSVGNESGVTVPAAARLVPGAEWDHAYTLTLRMSGVSVVTSTSEQLVAGDVQAVTVGAGTFNAIPIRGSVQSSTGTSTSQLSTTMWLAQGVGMIAQDVIGVGLSNSLRLVSYRVP